MVWRKYTLHAGRAPVVGVDFFEGGNEGRDDIGADVAVGTTPSRGRASTSYVFMAEHMQRARLWLPVGSHGLLGEVPQARLLDDIGEPHEPGLLGTENFAD